MSHSHSHDHCSHHHHHHGSDGNLSWAFGINLLLSVVQVIAGVAAGSLALIADAVHNLSDAASLALAWIAQKIAGRSPDSKRTYGYKKVETLAAYTNYVVLMLISVWLMFEAVGRFVNPEPIDGWVLVWVSAFAVVINLATVVLTHNGAQHSHNVRAAYLHNLGDAMSSVGVIVAGMLIVSFGWKWADALITLLISGYIFWQVAKSLPVVANILIDGTPEEIDPEDVTRAIAGIDGVKNVHHFHLRALDEHRVAVETHVVMVDGFDADQLRQNIKDGLAEAFSIEHVSIEIEANDCGVRECECS